MGVEILFLSMDKVITIHEDQIKDSRGSSGIRDIKLLESAVNSPRMTFDGKYLYTSFLEMAGAYAYHIIKNHAFIDGNKRTGMFAALLFLEINSNAVHLTNAQVFAVGMLIATTKISVQEIAILLMQND